MKITFPHMGNIYIPIRVLLDTIGQDYAMPPLCNTPTLEKGAVHSPEFACLPFKIMLGNFIYGIENGADAVLFGGGCGQCRLGYYGDLHAEILKSIGCNADFIMLELNHMSFKGILQQLKPITDGKRPSVIIKGVLQALKAVFIIDRTNRKAMYTRCREIDKGMTDSILTQMHKEISKVKGAKEICKVLVEAERLIEKVKKDNEYKPLKVVLVGEIYTLIEPYANFELEKKLGSMGVQVYETLSASHWIKMHLLRNLLPFKIKSKAHEAGKEFIKTNDIGGHGLETIGNIILAHKKKFDGAIQVYPLTCMPEIIAQSTFEEIHKKYDIPVMTLIVDEMTGENGYLTRIDAFADMLERRRTMKISKTGNIEKLDTRAQDPMV